MPNFQVCWTTDTYYLGYEEAYIPKEDDPKAMIGYYQWVPLILSFQAILFYLPRPIWMLLSKQSGVSVTTITDAAVEYQGKSDPAARTRIMSYMRNHMGRFLLELMANHALTSHCQRFWWRLYGKYLVITYISMKLLYLGNVIGQLFLLDRFLGLDYHFYGLDVIDRLATGKDWRTSDRFPRVTLCDIKIRVLGHIQRYTIQCSLPMNLLNEIIFIFIWFWLAFVCLATILSLIKWMYITVHVPGQIKYMKSRLIAMSKFDNKNKRIQNDEVWDFVRKFLRRDGCLLVRLVSQNASDIIAAELICELWEYYQSHKHSINSLFDTGEIAAGQRESNPFIFEAASQQLLEGGFGNGLNKCHSLANIDDNDNTACREMETQTNPQGSNQLSGSGSTPAAQNPLNTQTSTQSDASAMKAPTTTTYNFPNALYSDNRFASPGTESFQGEPNTDKTVRQIKRERSSHKKSGKRK